MDPNISDNQEESFHASFRRPSLARRSIELAIRRPEIIKSYLRLAFRQKIGTPFERKFGKGHAALPARLQIQPTRRCNLKCQMCIQHRHSSGSSKDLPWYDPNRELPIETWINLMDQCVPFRPWINISGGEPMLYAHFEQLVRAAYERGLPLDLNTNGTLLERHATMLVKNNVNEISISIDGTEPVHDIIRGEKGLFRKIECGIRALQKARHDLNSPTPIIQIACTVSKTNLSVLKDMVPLALDMQADILLFQHTDFNEPDNIKKHNQILNEKNASARGLNIHQPSVPEGEYYLSNIQKEDIVLLKESLRDIKKQAAGKIRVFTSPGTKLEDLEAYYLDINYPETNACKGLWTNFRIMPDGTVLPCLHLIAGNINEQPMAEIWNGPVMKNFRRLVSEKLLPGCARCCNRQF